MTFHSDAQLPGSGTGLSQPLNREMMVAQRALTPHGGPGEATAESSFDARDLLRIIFKWKWLILGCLVGCVLISVLITISMTPLFKATTTIEINSDPGDVMGQQTSVQPATNPAEFLNTQLGLLRSHALAQRVVQSLNLTGDPNFASGDSAAARLKSAASRVSGGLEVAPQPGSSLIQISYSDPNPDRAARVANAVSSNFISSNLERRYDASDYARNFLQTRLAAIRGKLETTERQLVAYAQQQGIIDLSNGASSSTDSSGDSLSSQSLTAINQSLAAATTDRIQAEQRYRQALASPNTTQVLDNSTVQQLRTQRAQLQAQYDQKLATFKPDLPEMVALRSEMASIDSNIAQQSKDVTSSLKSAYEEALGRENQIAAQVGELRGKVLNLRGRSIQYNILQRDVDTNRALYDALLQRYKEIGVAGGIGESQAVVVDPAQRPGSPYRPSPIINVGAGIVVGLMLGFGLAFAIEFIDDTIKSPEDVIGKLNVPLLGLIPKIGKDSSLSEELADQRSSISEAYFSVITSLQFATSSGRPRSVMVSSARAAEGKTSTALAIAQNFARGGSSVLLIDADLRKPSFRANAPEGRGLSILLTTDDEVADHVVGTFIPNLSLLPGGIIPPNPAELLAGGRIGTVIQEAGAIFDVVVIDAPPVLGLADAPILSSMCEATVMVVQSGIQRRPVLNSLRRLKEARATIAGVVLTKYNIKAAGYGYGYGYAYGYGERYGQDAESRQMIDMAS